MTPYSSDFSILFSAPSDLNYKSMGGSSQFKFGILAKIVKHMKVSYKWLLSSMVRKRQRENKDTICRLIVMWNLSFKMKKEKKV